MKVGVGVTSIEPLIGLTIGAAAGVVVVDEDEVDDVDEELDVELELELDVEEDVLVELEVVAGIVVVVADSTLRVTGTNSVVLGALLSTMSSAM
jgi:hypothetical protein